LVNSQEFQSLLYGEVYKEKAIRYKDNLRYIDLLVKSDVDALWNVIDYKSSMSFSEHHLKQVRYYNKAVNAITGEKVTGYLCYLLADEVKLVEV
jgi:exodeoxyribonuclease V beta subunit